MCIGTTFFANDKKRKKPPQEKRQKKTAIKKVLTIEFFFIRFRFRLITGLLYNLLFG